jgi:hypothetical protein
MVLLHQFDRQVAIVVEDKKKHGQLIGHEGLQLLNIHLQPAVTH